MTIDSRPAVLILGASTRAAAQSAARAGLRPICADLFADEDLRAVADVLPVHDYPRGLPAAARLAPACPWMYTGALENHPAIIEEISAARPLWGSAGDAVRRVRDPFWLSGVLRSAGLPSADVRASDDPPAADGTWLLKPLRGAAGRGIVVWDERAASSRTLKEPHYYQRRLMGPTYSALFVAWPQETVLAGLSRQLDDDASANSVSFRYCGSVGPVRLEDPVEELIQSLGDRIAREAGLRGLFGIDLIIGDTGVGPVEVNPRYTASVEVHELATDLSILRLHQRACEAFESGIEMTEDDRRTASAGPERRERSVVAKSILYAERDVVVPDFTRVLPAWDGRVFPALADIPCPGTRVAVGHPICTILASGQHDADVVGPARAIRAALDGGSPSAGCS